ASASLHFDLAAVFVSTQVVSRTAWRNATFQSFELYGSLEFLAPGSVLRVCSGWVRFAGVLGGTSGSLEFEGTQCSLYSQVTVGYLKNGWQIINRCANLKLLEGQSWFGILGESNTLFLNLARLEVAVNEWHMDMPFENR